MSDAFGWVLVEAERLPAAASFNSRVNSTRVKLEESCTAAAEDIMREMLVPVGGAGK